MSCSSSRSASLYDRQLNTALFKRFHATHFTLAPKHTLSVLGPGSYTPRTIEEIYRDKACSRHGRYYQQSERFSLDPRMTKSRCNSHVRRSFYRSVSRIANRCRSSFTGWTMMRMMLEENVIRNDVTMRFDSIGKATITVGNDELWEHAHHRWRSTRNEISSMNCAASKQESI